jgi:hypothetical protein
MFLFLNFKPKDEECLFAKEHLKNIQEASLQISTIFSAAFFNSESRKSNFQSQNLLQIYFGNVNVGIFSNSQARKVIKKINTLLPVVFEYDDDIVDLSEFNRPNELTIDDFVDIYTKIVEEFLPEVKTYF